MCIVVSHFHWTKKQIRRPNSFASDWALLSDPDPPPPPHLFQDVWTGYLSVQPGLGKAIATASAGWCRSTARPAVISVTVRDSSSRKQQQSRGGKKKKSLFSQLSSTRSCCEPFANGATGANRSSHAELWWGFARISFEGKLHLLLKESAFGSGE